MRSLEHSYHRLGMNRIDVVFIHDVDVGTYGSVDEYHRRRDEAMEGSYRALDELRGAGVIGAIGVGVNEVEPFAVLSTRAHIVSFDDVFVDPLGGAMDSELGHESPFCSCPPY